MALPNLPRVQQKIFGDVSSPINNFIQFGSLAAGAVQYTKDLALIQALAAFDIGWTGAVVGNKSPSLEDMNALFYLNFKQLAYLFQKGMAEWNADTTYYTGHLCASGGVIYRSKTENNLGNPVSDTNNWIEYVSSVLTLPTVSLSKTYLFTDRVKLVERGSATGYTSVDLTPYIATAGLNAVGITVRAAIIGLRVQLGRGPFGNYDADASVNAWGNNAAANPLFAYAKMSADDSVASASDTNCGPVPLLDANNLWYSVGNSTTSNGLFVQVFLSGFLYDQVVQL